MAARWFCQEEGDTVGNVIAVDMGGTSFDVSMVKEGQIAPDQGDPDRKRADGHSAQSTPGPSEPAAAPSPGPIRPV